MFIGTPNYSHGKLPYLSSECLLCPELILFQNRSENRVRRLPGKQLLSLYHLLTLTAIALQTLHTDGAYRITASFMTRLQKI